MELVVQVCLPDELTFDVLMFHKSCSYVAAVAWLVVFSLLHAVQVDDKSHAPMSCLCLQDRTKCLAASRVSSET